MDDEQEPLTADWLKQFAFLGLVGFLFVRHEQWRPLVGEQFIGVTVSSDGVVSIETIRSDKNGREERVRFQFPDTFTRRRFRELCAGLGIDLRPRQEPPA